METKQIQIRDYDYPLPDERIAKFPLPPARLQQIACLRWWSHQPYAVPFFAFVAAGGCFDGVQQHSGYPGEAACPQG